MTTLKEYLVEQANDLFETAGIIKEIARQLPDNGGNTSDEIATLAARGLDNPASLTPAELRRVCASALGQSVGE